MNKRKNIINTNEIKKKPHIEKYAAIKNIIIRNDCDPCVYVNCPSAYIKIGEHIYKTKSFSQHPKEISGINIDNTVALNIKQYKTITPYIFNNNKILVIGHDETITKINNLFVNVNTRQSNTITINKKKFIEFLHNYFVDHIVTVKQDFCVDYNSYKLNIIVNCLEGNATGIVDNSTRINLADIDTNIIVFNETREITYDLAKIIVKKCISMSTNNISKNDSSKLPLIIDYEKISNYAKNAFSGTFTSDENIIYSINGYEFTFCIKIPRAEKSKFKNVFVFKKNTEIIDIESATTNVIIYKEIVTAKKVCFNIKTSSSYKYNINDYIIPYSKLVSYIRTNINSLIMMQKNKYPMNKKEVYLEIEYINPYASENTLFEVNDKTIISFNKELKTNFIVVDNEEPFEIEDITFKLKEIPSFGLFGKINDKSKHIFELKKLRSIIKNIFPKKIACKLSKEITYEGYKCNIIVDNFNLKDKEQQKNKGKYGFCGLITNETKIKVITSSNNKNFVINNNDIEEIPKDPIGELEKYVGGISEELKVVTRTICLSRGKLRNEFRIRGLKAAKGIVFHGPPGTGKTTLARNIGKLLNCDGERFQLISGPEIFNKWVGESEANIRKLFKPAKDAWKKKEIDAPMYMIVIDEIDAILPARGKSSGNSVRDTVVNQFLTELDGLEQFENLICIGTTNRLELLDPAAIRPGRLGIHVKIDFPDRNGRIKIFEIHTRKLKEGNRLVNVNFSKLADITENFNGADIESVVQQASTYSLERLNKLEIIDESMIQTHGNITHADFERAIQEMSKMIVKTDHNYMKMFI